MMTPRRKRLTIDTISDRLKSMEYGKRMMPPPPIAFARCSSIPPRTARCHSKRPHLIYMCIFSSRPPVVRGKKAVRGKIAMEADRIAHELSKQKDGTSTSGIEFPFERIVYTNIGNPHAVSQRAITWPRQVLALLQLPDECGIDHPSASLMFPKDAIDRAREMKGALDGHGVGAYTHSKGARRFREDVARFIERRDMCEPGSVDAENIFLTAGASEAITMIMTALVRDRACGIMIPTPQYPLYSATLDLLGGQKVGYHLDEGSAWGLNLEELERSLADAQSRGVNVVGMVLINPGNPTGQVLSSDEVKDVVTFCSRHNIVLLSDEVYQENVYREGAKFFSARRAAHELGLIENNAIQLCSSHSVSKGVFGECGQRGGYVELVGRRARRDRRGRERGSVQACREQALQQRRGAGHGEPDVPGSDDRRRVPRGPRGGEEGDIRGAEGARPRHERGARRHPGLLVPARR